MALKAANTNAKAADCTTQENKKKVKQIRKKYSSKRTELQVRKRTIDRTDNTNNCEINAQYNSAANIPSEAIMFYPPCPQYYPITNEWSPVIPIQCPLYSLQPIPVIVNPTLLSTQIHAYPQIAGPSTVANEYQVSPLVLTNEFTPHMNDALPIVSSVDPAPLYYETPVVGYSSGFINEAVCDEVALPGIPIESLTAFENQVPNEVTFAVMPIELSPSISYISCDYSPIATPISHIFNTIQSEQVPNEFTPICDSACAEVSPLACCNYDSFSFEYFQCDLPIIDEDIEAEDRDYKNDINPLEFYLSLPKNLFPTARMMTVDPSMVIDEFCRTPHLDEYSWILDLEFGVPKSPVTRRVATYNVKLNSINCKNVPEAIHPGFEICDKDFKRALMLYYDCVISNWYRGYIALSSDKSVENFQSWLLLPMQTLGMCWS